jgi:hypothetical protein
MRQRIRSHLTYANVMVTLLAFVTLGGMSYAATGGNFILGKSNSASSKSTLSAPIADKALTVTNNSTQAGATALGLNVAKGHSPFRVNSGAKVANLNADKLDGIDSSQFPAVHLGIAPQGSGGTIIQWHDLGARIVAKSGNNSQVQVVNIRPSGNIEALWGGAESIQPPGPVANIDLSSSLTTFIVTNSEGTRSWLVACALEFIQSNIRCQGVASRFTG